ncbi:MAG: acyl-CoA dehydratase activase [Candidatus Aminicenantes bacterium]|nr:acyl-CoA dehydratase activase [Candidatus Aminicenantes bacterium]
MDRAAGIDYGSRTTKIVELKSKRMVFEKIFETTPESLEIVAAYLEKAGDIPVIATGYGRHLIHDHFSVPHVTEIRACARGCLSFFPDSRSILDVGGQDCKVISLENSGRVCDFVMNDRCAAGTGKFLEVMAAGFGSDLQAFIDIALGSSHPIPISSMCTVFAESEVVSLITSGKAREDIALGLHVSIADRLLSMLRKIGPVQPLVFVGGGAMNTCLHRMLEKKLKMSILRPYKPQLTTALGAALIAAEK